MILIVSKYLVPAGYHGFAAWPFVFLKRREYANDEVLINHEQIHLRQQLELLVLPFFIWYGLEFMIRFLRSKDWHKAYRAVSFEKEAYSNEKNAAYLSQRKRWRFYAYF